MGNGFKMSSISSESTGVCMSHKLSVALAFREFLKICSTFYSCLIIIQLRTVTLSSHLARLIDGIQDTLGRDNKSRTRSQSYFVCLHKLFCLFSYSQLLSVVKMAHVKAKLNFLFQLIPSLRCLTLQ